MNLEFPNPILGRRIQPALWSGKTITPYPYDSEKCLVASHAVSTVYYELPDILNIRGWCLILIDLDESTDTHLCISSELYNYVDKKPEHEGVHRVVKDSFHKVTVTKHTAIPGMAFFNPPHQITIEQSLDYHAGVSHELKLVLIDKKPDLESEIINDLLIVEVQDEIDRTILKQMVEQVEKEKQENGNCQLNKTAVDHIIAAARAKSANATPKTDC